MHRNVMRQIANVARALSDPSRVQLLLALRDGERCVCQLHELVDLSISSTSRHLAILAEAGLIVGHREGRWMHYRLPGWDAEPIVAQAVQWVLSNAGTPTVAKSAKAGTSRPNSRRGTPRAGSCC